MTGERGTVLLLWIIGQKNRPSFCHAKHDGPCGKNAEAFLNLKMGQKNRPSSGEEPSPFRTPLQEKEKQRKSM